MIVRLIGALIVAIMILSACGSDNDSEDPVSDMSAIPTTAPDGEMLCDFIPRESVALALGTDEFEVDNGEVSRASDGAISSAGCRIRVNDELTFTASVGLAAEGYERNGFEKRLDRDDYNQLPGEAGLGFTWADNSDLEGGTVSTGEAWVLYGVYFVRVWVAGLVEDRDHEADAAAVAQQARQTLNIADEWTLPGSPPSR